MRNKNISKIGGLVLATVLSGGIYAQQAPGPMSFFITSAGSGDGGNLGGLEGADAVCQALCERIGIVAQLTGDGENPLPRGGGEVAFARERQRDGGLVHPQRPGNIMDRRWFSHGVLASFPTASIGKTGLRPYYSIPEANLPGPPALSHPDPASGR